MRETRYSLRSRGRPAESPEAGKQQNGQNDDDSTDSTSSVAFSSLNNEAVKEEVEADEKPPTLENESKHFLMDNGHPKFAQIDGISQFPGTISANAPYKPPAKCDEDSKAELSPLSNGLPQDGCSSFPGSIDTAAIPGPSGLSTSPDPSNSGRHTAPPPDSYDYSNKVLPNRERQFKSASPYGPAQPPSEDDGTVVEIGSVAVPGVMPAYHALSFAMAWRKDKRKRDYQTKFPRRKRRRDESSATPPPLLEPNLDSCDSSDQPGISDYVSYYHQAQEPHPFAVQEWESIADVVQVEERRTEPVEVVEIGEEPERRTVRELETVLRCRGCFGLFKGTEQMREHANCEKQCSLCGESFVGLSQEQRIKHFIEKFGAHEAGRKTSEDVRAKQPSWMSNMRQQPVQVQQDAQAPSKEVPTPINNEIVTPNPTREEIVLDSDSEDEKMKAACSSKDATFSSFDNGLLVEQARNGREAYRCTGCFTRYWNVDSCKRHQCSELYCSLCRMPFDSYTRQQRIAHYKTFHEQQELTGKRPSFTSLPTTKETAVQGPPGPSTSAAPTEERPLMVLEVLEPQYSKTAYRCTGCFTKYWNSNFMRGHKCLKQGCSLCDLPFTGMSIEERIEHFKENHEHVSMRLKSCDDIGNKWNRWAKELEAKRKAEEAEAKKKAEMKRQQQAEIERQEKAEMERQLEAERQRQQKALMERRQKAEMERQQKTTTTTTTTTHQCIKCEMLYLSQSALDEHQMTCLRLKCPQCDNCFAWAKSRDMHLLHAHGHLTEKLRKCKQCKKTFDDASEFIQHLEECVTIVRQARNGRWACPRCAKQFDGRDEATRHIYWMHLSPVEITCKKCGKVERNEFSLRYHVVMCGYDPQTAGGRADVAGIRDRLLDMDSDDDDVYDEAMSPFSSKDKTPSEERSISPEDDEALDDGMSSGEEWTPL